MNSQSAVPEEMGEPMLIGRALSLGYHRTTLIRSLSFEVRRGEILGIVGPNGSGKTTLLRAMLGLLKPLEGTVERKAGLAISYMPQRERIDAVLPLTALEVVLMGRTARAAALRRIQSEDRDAARHALGLVGAEPLSGRLYRNLSGGQQQRVLLARAIAAESDMLVLDEPTAGMDVASEAAMIAFLQELNHTRALTIVMVTHLLPVVLNLASSVMLLSTHSILHGRMEEVLKEESLTELYGIPIHLGNIAGKRTLVVGQPGIAVLEQSFIRLALIASAATGVALSVMGTYLVIKRIVFMGLVLASAATVGAALAQIVNWPPEVSSVAASVATALGLGAIQKPRRIAAESIMGWAYAATSAATVLILSRTRGADMDALHLLYGNLLAVSNGHAVGLVILAVVIGFVHILFGRRFLLVTFDPEAARVAGVNTTLWSLSLNLLIGVVTAAAVHEIGALLTFSLLTLAPAAALLTMRSIRSTFAMAATLGVVLACSGVVASFYLDLPPGPTSVALLAVSVPVAALVGRRDPLTRSGPETGNGQ